MGHYGLSDPAVASFLETLEPRELLSAHGGHTAAIVTAAVTPAITLSLDSATIVENDSAALTGTLQTPLASAQSLVIDWGDGQSTILALDVGATGFNSQHQYLDEPADNGVFTIQATIGTGDTALTGSTSILVANAAPVVSSLTADPQSINENDSTTLTGVFTDPGTLDTHSVAIDWGDGSTSTVDLGAGVLTFSATHQYLNNAVGTTSSDFKISAVVTDDDTASDSGQTQVSVANVAPVVTSVVADPQSINENDSTTLTGIFTDPGTLDTHSVSIDWGDGSTSTVNLGAGVLTFSASHQYLNNAVGTSSSDFNVSVSVTDEDGAVGTGGTKVTVANVPPEITSLNVDPVIIDENGSTTLTGDFTDPGTLDTHTVAIDWGDGNTSTINLAAGVLTFSQPHQYLNNAVGTSQSDFTINVTVTDDDSAQSISDTVVTVRNVPPVITSVTSSAIGVGDAAEGQAVTINGSFTDVGTLDTHTATIDWGDGTTSSAAVTEQGGSGTFLGTHAYSSGGVFNVQVTVTDEDSATDTTSTIAVVSGVGINNGVLQIIGTSGADDVHVNLAGKGKVKVHANFLSDRGRTRTLDFSGVAQIQALMGDGSDSFDLAGNIATPLFLDGGAGNDRLKGSRGPAVIVGGDGDDFIQGGKGNDVLIGGLGADRIIGGPGNDLITGGRSIFDPNDNALTADFSAALMGILNEWTGGRSLPQRQANISGTGTGERLNGDFFLQTGVTVFDAGGDKITTCSGQDWLFDALVAKPGKGKGNGNGGMKGTVVTAPTPVTPPAPTTQTAGQSATSSSSGGATNSSQSQNQDSSVTTPLVTPVTETPLHGNSHANGHDKKK